MVGAWGEDACSTEVVSSTVVVDELPLTAGDNGCLYAGAAYVFLRYGNRWRLQVNLAAAALLAGGVLSQPRPVPRWPP